MIKKQLLLVLLITTILCVGIVNAAEVTMKVDSKHIVGSGLGNNPLYMDDCINVVYVISEMRTDTCGNSYILQEYPVSIQDYCKVKTGQTITLNVPDSRLETCTIVDIK